jgi:hypothetical protein
MVVILAKFAEKKCRPSFFRFRFIELIAPWRVEPAPEHRRHQRPKRRKQSLSGITRSNRR